MIKSAGHIGFYRTFDGLINEIYLIRSDIWESPVQNVLNSQGIRPGKRLCTLTQWTEWELVDAYEWQNHKNACKLFDGMARAARLKNDIQDCERIRERIPTIGE